ncbi:MAG: EamA family transporter [Xanthobacteraceae bacterium]|nr:EamA family transporter [Xanthobacteraceae bacterium]
MPTHVMLLVLFGALLHASWNAMVKSGGDKLTETGLIAGGGAVVSLAALPFVPLPATACVPWMVVSIAIHQLYYALVAAAYHEGDMGHAYPLMRGAAPLLVALASAPLIGETLSLHGWLGVMLICGGILLLALHRHAAPRATWLALANAVVIAVYTLIDGTGARLSGNAASYVLWLTFLEAFPLLTWLWLRDRAGLRRQLRRRGAIGLIGGACAVGSYGVALWAMTQAPVAAVAALRETSVLFAVVIAMAVLRERGGVRRLIAGALVVAGAAVLRLA